jgi:hypothetical protein
MLAHNAFEARWPERPREVGKGSTVDEAVRDLAARNPEVLDLNIEVREDPWLTEE